MGEAFEAGGVITATNGMDRRWLSIVGIGENGRDGFPPAAHALVEGAELIVGGERHLTLLGPVRAETLVWRKPFRDTIQAILKWSGRPVCVLASGDPFWFGAGAALAEAISPVQMLTVPAPSTFSLAAARLGWPLQNTVTLGLHVNRPESILRHLHEGCRILALSLDGATPCQVALLLTRYAFGQSRIHVMEALGGVREKIFSFRADDPPSNAFGPLNVIAIETVAGCGARIIPFAPGLPDDYFEHDGQITKREVRAITLSALRPSPGALLWDIGLGSGSVAIEWLLCHSRMRAVGFEKSAERAARALRNAIGLGVPHLQVRKGEAPLVLVGVEAPDAIFIGGGAGETRVLQAGWAALKPGGRLVCNAVTMEGQAALFECRKNLGGSLTRIAVEREHTVGRFKAWHPAMPVVQWVAEKPWP